MTEDSQYHEQVTIALDQLFLEFVKILKKEKGKVSARATQFVLSYKKISENSAHYDLEQRANLVKLMAQLAVEKTDGKQRLTITLANEVKSLYEKVKLLRSDWQQVVKVEEAFAKLDILVVKTGQGLIEAILTSPEYKALKQLILEKPGQVAKLFVAMAVRLDRFLHEPNIKAYFRQLILWHCVLAPLVKDSGLSMLAKGKLQRLFTATAKHVNARLRALPLDEQKQQLQDLEPALLALILAESPLELQRLFESAIAEDETFLGTFSYADLSIIESKLKAKEQLDDEDLLLAVSNSDDIAVQVGSELAGLLEDDEELLLIIEAFTHNLAGDKQIHITKEEQQKIWRILQIITVLSARLSKNQKGAKEWRARTTLILNKVVEVLQAYPQVVINTVVSKLPKAVQVYVLAKLNQKGSEANLNQPIANSAKKRNLAVLPLKKSNSGKLV